MVSTCDEEKNENLTEHQRIFYRVISVPIKEFFYILE